MKLFLIITMLVGACMFIPSYHGLLAMYYRKEQIK